MVLIMFPLFQHSGPKILYTPSETQKTCLLDKPLINSWIIILSRNKISKGSSQRSKIRCPNFGQFGPRLTKYSYEEHSIIQRRCQYVVVKVCFNFKMLPDTVVVYKSPWFFFIKHLQQSLPSGIFVAQLFPRSPWVFNNKKRKVQQPTWNRVTFEARIGLKESLHFFLIACVIFVVDFWLSIFLFKKKTDFLNNLAKVLKFMNQSFPKTTVICCTWKWMLGKPILSFLGPTSILSGVNCCC